MSENYSPAQRQSSSRHVRLSRVREQTNLSRSRTTKASAVDPNIYLFVACETSVHLCCLSNSYQRRMRVTMIAVPDGCVARGGVVFEAIDDQLDRGSGVCSEDEVEFGRIGIEKSESAFTNGVNPVTGYR
jgi:hypothetical protein